MEKDRDRTYLGSVLEEIWKTSEDFDMCRYQFIPRSGNTVAHCLAQLAHLEPNSTWKDNVPPSLLFVDEPQTTHASCLNITIFFFCDDFKHSLCLTYTNKIFLHYVQFFFSDRL